MSETQRSMICSSHHTSTAWTRSPTSNSSAATCRDVTIDARRASTVPTMSRDETRELLKDAILEYGAASRNAMRMDLRGDELTIAYQRTDHALQRVWDLIAQLG